MPSKEDFKKDADSKRSNRSQRSKRPKRASREAGSQRSKRSKGESKEAVKKKKNPKSQKKPVESSSKQSPSSKKPTFSGETSASKQVNNSFTDPGSAEPLRSSLRHVKKDSAENDKRDSCREKKSAENVVASNIEKVIRIFSGEKCETPRLNHICSDTFGYGREFPDEWLEEPQTIELKVEPPKKVPLLKVSTVLIIYEVPEELSTQVQIGDILYKFNDLPLSTRDEYTKHLSVAMKNQNSQTLTFTILRPIKSKIIPAKELSNVFAKLQQPLGFGILPTHFDYLYVYLTVAPKTTLGVRIKGYNGKVYVSGIENKGSSIAYKCLLVGDAIVAIEDSAISFVKETEDMLTTAFSKKKFVKLIIERPKTAAGIKNVKQALASEKTVEINPRMNEDIIEICEQQIIFMCKNPRLKPAQRIYWQKQQPHRPDSSHVSISAESIEQPISTDVNNVQFLAPTPPVPSTPPGTRGTFDPLGLKSKRTLERFRKKFTK